MKLPDIHPRGRARTARPSVTSIALPHVVAIAMKEQLGDADGLTSFGVCCDREDFTMQKFLVLYRSRMSVGEQMASTTPEERQASMDAWTAWGAAAGDALVDWGVPTQPTTDEDPGPAGWIGGYSILQAADVPAVRAVLSGHPHNQLGSIEILEMLDMPGS